MLRDEVVKFWLSEFWFIAFIVTVTSVANHIDEDILAEFLTVFYSKICYEVHRFRIVTIDVQNRSINNLCKVSTIDTCSRIIVVSCESNLVVDHKMDRSPSCVTRQA